MMKWSLPQGENMATTGPPSECPECNKDYLSRIPKRYDHRMKLSKCYRCRSRSHIYIHEI